jgi:hypothetical protein
MIMYRVVDDKDKCYGTFNTQEYAKEHAQETANEIKKDVFVEKITVENIGCFIPE